MCAEKQNLPQGTSHPLCVVKTEVRNRVRTLHSCAEGSSLSLSHRQSMVVPEGDLRRQRTEAMKLVQYKGLSKAPVEELPWSTGLLDIWKDPELLSMSMTGRPARQLPAPHAPVLSCARARGCSGRPTYRFLPYRRWALRRVLHLVPSCEDLCRRAEWGGRVEAPYRPHAQRRGRRHQGRYGCEPPLPLF
jgi:hypothetical protein